MTIGFIMALVCVCIACRCIIFKKHEVKWIWGLVPGANKYKLGKIVNSKKLGLAVAITHVLLAITFTLCFGFEIWIIKTYTATIKIPVKDTTISKVEVVVPKDVANLAVWSKYVLIIIAAIALILWCILMWKFTIRHDRNPWWIMLWAIIPVIPYIAFASSQTVVIDGKKYKLQKVEITEEDKTTEKSSKKSKRKIKHEKST